MNIIYVLGIISTSLALWFIPSDNYFVMCGLFFLMGFFIFGPQFLIAMAAAESLTNMLSRFFTGFVSLFAYIGAAAAGAPLAWIIQSLHWNGFFGSLFIVSLACAFVHLFSCTSCSVKKNKLKAKSRHIENRAKTTTVLARSLCFK